MRYIATRERVELIQDDRPPTRKQEQLIVKLVKDFPDARDLDEYADYQEHPTKANASAFISQALEENWSDVQKSDGYMKYIATRPRAERLGTHGLFGDKDGVELDKAMEELEAAITAVSDAMGENIYDSVERGRQRSEAFNEKHPDIAEKSREYMADIWEKRNEINQKAKEREDAGKEALAARKAELEARLARLKGRNIVHRRIANAYPQLLEGKNNGANFRKLKESWERRRNGENQ